MLAPSLLSLDMDLQLASFTMWRVAFIAFVAFLVIRRLHWEYTTGANRRRLIRENKCLPPKPFPHRGVLGNLLGLDLFRENMKNAADGHLHSRARDRVFMANDTNTIELRVLWKKFISTIEPNNIKCMLSTNFGDWALPVTRAKVLVPALGHGIFNNNGVQWERSRALIRPNFTRSQVADLNTFEHHIDNLIQYIPSDGGTVDIQELFFKLSMDSSTQFLFGQSTNVLAKNSNDELAKAFAEAFTAETAAMAQDFRTIGVSQWFVSDKRKANRATIHRFADKIIQEALQSRKGNSQQADLEKQQYTFLFELMKLTDDHYTIRSELLNVLLAGRDTTASLLSHTFFELARRPNVWNKLQAEISELNGKVPDYETLKSLKYVKFVLNESLRVYPVVPSNGREAVRDTVLPLGGGPDGKSPLLVTKGSIVTYSSWSLHRRTDFYGEDALEYRPERWASLRPAYEYIPFNAGSRICLGQNFALTEAAYTLVRILQHYTRIESRDSRPWSEFLTLTMAVGNGVKIGLYRE